MTSKIKVDNINKVSDDSNIIKKCGTTTTIGSGASNPIVVDGSAVTLGRCGGTVALASGATQTGFGRTGTVDWQTGSIKTSTFTAANGEGYFADTSSGAFTMNLPAGTAGNIVSAVDYTNTFQTHNLTVAPNGSQKIGGVAASATLSTEGQSVTFVYVDDTEGWKNVQDSSSNVTGISFITATGGTTSTCGNCKIHTFTGPGTFCVSGLATDAANNEVSYVVVAGGGGGGCNDYTTGGGGAGGFRETKSPVTPYTASPLDGQPSAPNRITVTATGFPIAVGGGGAVMVNGVNSSFSTITAAGGGFGGKNSPSNGGPGGSGGGGRSIMDSPTTSPGGTGNTPPVSPPQGNNGGQGPPMGRQNGGGGGGGAGAVGTAGSVPTAGPGGNGVPTGINPSTCVGVPGPAPGRWFAGGGGGGSNAGADGGTNTTGGCGGEGGGGRGAARGPGYPSSRTSTAGTANTGSGGGAAGGDSNGGSAGGPGIVIIRYKVQ